MLMNHSILPCFQIKVEHLERKGKIKKLAEVIGKHSFQLTGENCLNKTKAGIAEKQASTNR